MRTAPEVGHLPRDISRCQPGEMRGLRMPVARESVTRCAGPDVRPIAERDDIRDRCVMIIRKPVRRIPVVVDLLLRALQRAARHGPHRLPVEIEISLRKQRLVNDLIGPLEIGSGHERGHQRQKRD